MRRLSRKVALLGQLAALDFYCLLSAPLLIINQEEACRLIRKRDALVAQLLTT